MDLLGGFDFGRLIRMFLPGVILLAGFVLAADAVYDLIESNSSSSNAVLKLVTNNQPIFLALSLPLTLICGLLVNAVMFVTNITRLVGPTKERRNLSTQMINELIRHCDTKGRAKKLYDLSPEWAREALSLESFLLPILSPERILYLKGHFYYYLQFNIAFGLSVIGLELSFLGWMLVYLEKFAGAAFSYLFLISILLCGAVVFLLFKAAQRNYKGNVRADLSLYLGALCLTQCLAGTGSEAGDPFS